MLANGEPRTQIRNRQEKNDGNVASYLTPIAQQAIIDWVKESGKLPHHFVFTRRKAIDGRPISKSRLRKVVKAWVVEIGGNPEQFSGHTLRRTKAIYLYKNGYASIEMISELLGHASVTVTRRYLGITAEEAEAAALKGDIHQHDLTKSPLTHPLLYHLLEPIFLDRFAEALAVRMAPIISDFIDKNGRKSRK
jgi:integrase